MEGTSKRAQGSPSALPLVGGQAGLSGVGPLALNQMDLLRGVLAGAPAASDLGSREGCQSAAHGLGVREPLPWKRRACL